MKKMISSAGLIYLYLAGYEENGMLYMKQINTYNHIGSGFYERLMAAAAEADVDENSVHVFAVIGIKEKTDKICAIIENELKSNYQQILSGKNIRKVSDGLDEVGNIFFVVYKSFFVNS